MLEASGLYLFQVLSVESMNGKIRRHLPIIDDLLTELISPTHSTVPLAVLVEKYGYPDADLDEIDMDWV